MKVCLISIIVFRSHNLGKKVNKMKKANEITFSVKGKYALFSNPLNRVSGEKFSYPVPSYEALKGVVKSIYFKPTISWYIDEVRIMNQIQYTTQGIRPIDFHGGNTLSYYTYLTDVEYQVKAHFEWNLHHDELEQDRNENKHYFIAKKMLKRGGRRAVFLGTSECQAYVEPCEYGDKSGFYDNQDTMPLGTMVHGFIYPDEWVNEDEKDKLIATFWNPTMLNGIIKFIRPEQCEIRRAVGTGEIKRFLNNVNFKSIEEEKEEGEAIELG